MLQSALLHHPRGRYTHGFTTREDGDLRPGAEGQAAAAARIVHALGGTGPLLAVTQVHGARVVDGNEAAEAMRAGTPLEADAIISTREDAVIAVRVADCVPILLTAPGGVAAIHAGWRGSAADITRIGLRALCDATGCSPSEVRAAIGPCISAAVYEVGPNVIEGLSGVAVNDLWRTVGPNGRDHANLALLNADILRDAGARVDVLGLCTVGDARFWSYRRDGETGGRQAAVIRWAGG